LEQKSEDNDDQDDTDRSGSYTAETGRKCFGKDASDQLITGVGNDGGYHAGMVIGRMLEQMADPNNLYEGVDENRDLQRRKDE